jgi:hypothetical protein
MGGDLGRIRHYLPGKMILYSDRKECETSRRGSWRNMDRDESNVRVRSIDNPNFVLTLLAVDKREQISDIPCGTFVDLSSHRCLSSIPKG